eukprot:COSAG01_NODE_28939_length_649_cov_0.847273_1_plen_48_part_10
MCLSACCGFYGRTCTLLVQLYSRKFPTCTTRGILLATAMPATAACCLL